MAVCRCQTGSVRFRSWEPHSRLTWLSADSTFLLLENWGPHLLLSVSQGLLSASRGPHSSLLCGPFTGPLTTWWLTSSDYHFCKFKITAFFTIKENAYNKSVLLIFCSMDFAGSVQDFARAEDCKTGAWRGSSHTSGENFYCCRIWDQRLHKERKTVPLFWNKPHWKH